MNADESENWTEPAPELREWRKIAMSIDEDFEAVMAIVKEVDTIRKSDREQQYTRVKECREQEQAAPKEFEAALSAFQITHHSAFSGNKSGAEEVSKSKASESLLEKCRDAVEEFNSAIDEFIKVLSEREKAFILMNCPLSQDLSEDDWNFIFGQEVVHKPSNQEDNDSKLDETLPTSSIGSLLTQTSITLGNGMTSLFNLMVPSYEEPIKEKSFNSDNGTSFESRGSDTGSHRKGSNL